jgi:hypothetical protein
MERFIGLVRAGRKPSVVSYLKGCPQFAESLRPVLEGAVLLYEEYGRFRKKYPKVDIETLFGVPKS